MADSFVNTSEVSKAIIDFIGSDSYKVILDNIEDTKESGFMTGVATAVLVILSKCPKYVGNTREEVQQEIELSLKNCEGSEEVTTSDHPT